MQLTQQLAAIFSDYAAHHLFSGAGLVKTSQSVLFEGAFGYASRSWQIQNTLETRFDTASITKLFTTVAMLQLIDQGSLALDTHVVDFLQLGDTTISRDITVYHLLTHTSGIGDDADEEAGESYEAIWQDRPNYAVRETRDFLPQFLHKPPNFPPGAGCRYNNVSFILLGLIIEQLTGQPYRDYVQTAIFEPLGMHRTAFLSMDGVHHQVAEGYAPIYDAQGALRGWRKNIYAFPPIGSPDGGAYTTVYDLDRFIRALRAGALLSKGSTQLLLTPQVFYRNRDHEPDRPIYREMMGLGFHFLMDADGEVVFLKKDGENTGVSCILSYYPRQDATLIILANQDCDVWQMSWEIHDRLIAANLP